MREYSLSKEQILAENKAQFKCRSVRGAKHINGTLFSLGLIIFMLQKQIRDFLFVSSTLFCSVDFYSSVSRWLTVCGAPGQTQSAWEALGWENCRNIMSPWAAHPTQVPFLLRHNGSQTMTVNNSLITHIPFYLWLEWKSTMFLRRPSWPSPEPWEQYSPDISTAHKMLTWVLRCAYNIHEGQEAHKLANLPLKKKKRTDWGLGRLLSPCLFAEYLWYCLSDVTNALKLREDLHQISSTT